MEGFFKDYANIKTLKIMCLKEKKRDKKKERRRKRESYAESKIPCLLEGLLLVEYHFHS